MTYFHESEVEQAAIGWLEGLGWAVTHGPDFVLPGAPAVMWNTLLLEPVSGKVV